MIGQVKVIRNSKRVDCGTMGFSDWNTEYEDIDLFIDRVTQVANNLDRNQVVTSISYPNNCLAIIVYKEG